MSGTTSLPSSPAAGHAYDRHRPFLAPVTHVRTLTAPGSTKSTIHLELDLTGSGLSYVPGDAAGILPENDPLLVEAICTLTGFSPQEAVRHERMGDLTLGEVLRRHATISQLSRRIVKSAAERTRAEALRALEGPEAAVRMQEYLHGRDIIDLLAEHPRAFETAQQLVEALPALPPRLYSIASSPAAHGQSLHLTVAVVRYRSHDERERKGVCSTYVADRVPIGQMMPVYLHTNPKFRLPADPGAPIIMVGPGTGIAPFRSFLYERQATAARGRNWLFFGERSQATDFLYRAELEAMRESGLLTRLDTAFSRDQAEKIYVQDRMRENSAELWKWLEEGASFYICGDAAHMAKDVELALAGIGMKHGRMDEAEARKWLTRLREQGRYMKDVY